DLPDNFTYTVSDADGSTDSATQYITVTDGVPTAVDDATVSVEEGGNAVTGNVMANDSEGPDGATVTSFTYTDSNGQTQTATVDLVNGVTVTTQYGALTVASNGDWSFTPDTAIDHDGAATVGDAFTYTLTDGDGDSSTATQAFTIEDTTPEVELTVTQAEGYEDQPIALDIEATLTSTNSNVSISVTLSNVPTDATLVTAGGQVLTGASSYTLSAADLPGLTIQAGEHSADDFAIEVSATATNDVTGESTTAGPSQVPVVVHEVADDPTLTVDQSADVVGDPGTDDDIDGTAGGDTIHGGGGDDTIDGMAGDDELHGDTFEGRVSIDLDISSALVDQDGSEELTVTLTNLPAGATLTAGGVAIAIANGSATLTADQLDDLVLEVDSDTADFDIGVSARTVDTDFDDGTTDTSDTLTDTISVSISDAGQAGNDTISGGAGDDTIFGNAGDDVLRGDGGEADGTVQTGQITAGNYDSTENGFTVTARVINNDGTLSDATTDNVSVGGSNDGTAIGVKGTPESGVAGQLGYDPTEDTSEQLIVGFDNPVSSATVGVSNLYATEGAGGEQGHWQAYSNGQLVGESDFMIPNGGNIGTISIDLPPGVTFDQLVFTATPYQSGQGGNEGDSSDYWITSIDYEYVTPGDAEGNDTIFGQEGDDIIDGDGGDDVLSGGTGNDTIDGGTGIDDVHAGDGEDTGIFTIGEGGAGERYDGGTGTDTLVVRYSAADLSDPAIAADMLALQQFIADNADPNTDSGAEQSFSALGLTVQDWEDVRFEGPPPNTDVELSLGPAEGVEDNQIALNLNATLATPTAVLTLAVTISDIPQGAKLFDTSGNEIQLSGNSVTLSPAQLSGLKILPPQDSGDDFDLSVSTTVTNLLDGSITTETNPLPVAVAVDADDPTLTVDSESVSIGDPGTDDDIDGGADSDTIYGGGGDDTIDGHGDDDLLYGDTFDGANVADLDIQSALTDTDGSETLTITLSDIPSGATLTNAAGDTITITNGTAELQPDQLSGLQITTPQGTGDYTLTVSAQTLDTDADDGSTDLSNVVTAQITVDVTSAEDGDDTITGGAGDDTIFGQGGDDVIHGDGVPEGGAGIADHFPSYAHDLSNVVLYLDDGNGNFTKVKIEDFPSGQDGIQDPDLLPLNQFVEQNYQGMTLVGATVKAGNNGVSGYGPGEGELTIILDGEYSVGDLPTGANADDELSFDDAFDGMTIGPQTDWLGGGDPLVTGGNDFVDDGSMNHNGTGADETYVVNRDLVMNENFHMGGGDDVLVVDGNTLQGSNLNMGDGNDHVKIVGDIGGNTAVDGGSGDDVLYLGKAQSAYQFQNFTNNQGHINTQIIDLDTGQTLTVNNIEAIAFEDGSVIGDASLVRTGEADQNSYDDTLYGGAGNDTIFGDQGSDIVYGDDGDDVIYGDGVPDLSGGAGQGSGSGSGSEGGIGPSTDGNDFVDSSAQNHQGTSGADTYVVDRDLRMNENFQMGDGDDTLVVNGDTSQGNNLNMGGGNDHVNPGQNIQGNTAIDGGSGDDVLYLSKGEDAYQFQNFTNNQGHINTQIIDLDTGHMLTVNNIEAIAFGDGHVVGNPDLVQYNAGDGSDGNGDGNVTGHYDDTLFGGAGDDRIFGNQGDDTLDGGTGSDTLDGGAGIDTVYGGDGDDSGIFVVGQGGDGERYDGGVGTDTLTVRYTEADLQDPAIVADLRALQQFIADNSNPATDSGAEMTFEAIGLTVQDWEDIVFDGPPIPNAINAADDSAAPRMEGGESITGNLLDNDTSNGAEVTTFTYTDENGQQQTGTVGQAVDTQYGTLTVNSDGSYSYVTDASEDHSNGALSESITYTLSNGVDVDTATATFQITDGTPTAVDDATVTVEEGGAAVTGDVMANDVEGPDGATLTSFGYTDANGQAQTANAGSTVTTANGSLTVNGDGTWSFTPNASVDNTNGAVV
ncbi:hypothetical protein KAJ83_19125, partial [Marivibrio halodurans]